MNNEVLAKKHILCEKAPFPAMILGCLIASVVIGVHPLHWQGTRSLGRSFHALRR